ncbi:MAG: hypothetical protein AAB368_10430, partial [bacterium]
EQAAKITEDTRLWLLKQMYQSSKTDVGKVLHALYGEVFAALHTLVQGRVPEHRLQTLYDAFYKVFNRKWPRVYGSGSHLSTRGINVAAMWDRTRAQCGDPQTAAEEFVPALDALVHELLRVIFLARGSEGRMEALGIATEILKKHNEALHPFGLNDVVGRDWVLTAPA